MIGPSPDNKLVKVKVLHNSTKALAFLINIRTSLLKVRQQLKTKEIQLSSDYFFTLPDQSIVSRSSEGEISLEMILDKDTFYLSERQQLSLEKVTPKSCMMSDQVSQMLNEKSEKYIQLEQNYKKLQKDLQQMHKVYKSKQSTFKPINSKYTGETNKDGLYQGLGKLSYDNGSHYLGNFKNGLLNGLGMHLYPSGDILRGEYKNGVANGLTVYAYTSGIRAVSVYCNNKAEGIAILYYPGGERLEGWIQGGNLEGEAIWRYPNGTTKLALYKNNVPI